MWTDTLTHTHKYGNKAQRRSVPSCILCNNVLFLPVFSPPPPSVSLASHDELDVIFPFFPLNLGEQKQASICACLCVCTVWCTRMCVCVRVFMWAAAKCFHHDVISLLCLPSALLPFLLHHRVPCTHTHTHTDAQEKHIVVRIYFDMQRRRVKVSPRSRYGRDVHKFQVVWICLWMRLWYWYLSLEELK